MDASSLSIPIATILSVKLSKSFSLDQTSYTMMYSSLVSVIAFALNSVMKYDKSEFTKLFTVFNGLAFIFFTVAGYIVYLNGDELIEKIEEALVKIGLLKDKSDSNPDAKSFVQLNIYNTQDINKFLDYVNLYSDFYVKSPSTEFGNPKLFFAYSKNFTYSQSNDVNHRSLYHKAQNDIVITFHDKNFDKTGYYVWKAQDIVVGSENPLQVQLPYIQLYIKNKESQLEDVVKYYNNIKEKYAQETINKINLKHVKVVKKSDKQDSQQENNVITSEYSLYTGLKKSPEALEKLYISTFFHKDKIRLWNNIKTIQYNPESIIKLGQSPRISLLLHGPPGTGKSSFPYRLAMALNRHLISIDGKTIKTKSAMYNLMRSPIINGEEVRPKDVIFTFDEVHLFLIYLKSKAKKESSISRYFYSERYNDFVGPKHLMTSSSTPEKRKSEESEEDEDEIPDLTENFEQAASGKKHSKKSKKSNTKDETEPDPSDFSFNEEDITINDLLEIFQGPVPLDGSIIIATTNFIEEIKKMCPALIRHGRLTPVYFGNLEDLTFQEMSVHFFGTPIDVTIGETKIPPSHAVDLMADIRLNRTDLDKEEQVELCKEQILELMKTYENSEKTQEKKSKKVSKSSFTRTNQNTIRQNPILNQSKYDFISESSKEPDDLNATKNIIKSLKGTGGRL